MEINQCPRTGGSNDNAALQCLCHDGGTDDAVAPHCLRPPPPTTTTTLLCCTVPRCCGGSLTSASSASTCCSAAAVSVRRGHQYEACRK